MPTIIRTVAGLAIGGAALWGVAGIDDTTRDDTGQIVEEGDLGVFVTQVGDCLNFEDPAATLVSMTKGVPCSTQHHWQVIFKAKVSVDEYDEVEIENEVDYLCENALEDLVEGLSDEKLDEYQNATTFQLLPSRESFAEGDRTVDCLIGSDKEYYFSSLFD